MQQQLNTPEDLRAIRQAMDEGKNPLVETDVPRWEDQVGISRIVNHLNHPPSNSLLTGRIIQQNILCQIFIF